MSDFFYEKPYPLTEDKTEYRLITKEFVSVEKLSDREVLRIDPKGLKLLAKEAFKDVSFFLRASHLEKLALILKDPEASDNDKFVAYNLLQNSAIAAKLDLPTCQDTGTAIAVCKKGELVYTGVDDAKFISEGVFETYKEMNLRYSQVIPTSMTEEKNSLNNLPAQIDIYSKEGNSYNFLFMAKGGGSANKTYLFQETKALLSEESLLKFFTEKVKYIGTSACPPYHLAIVIGGTSAEANLKIVKEASTGYLDGLPTVSNGKGSAFRDLEWEKKVLEICQNSHIGAQFGGKYYAHDVRVIRLPRHAASCPVGIGVSCSADRNIKAKITKDGIFLEQMETNPARFLPATPPSVTEAVKIDLDKGMAEVLKELAKYPIKTRLLLSGTLVVARDMAHARIKEILDRGEEMPQYMKDYPVYYAGPAKTPKGYATGSFGPTTAGRMDSYVGIFQAKGGSMVMVAKGNRTPQVKESCQKNGGFYLGSIGGPAAILAEQYIKSVEVIDFEELGMEAVRKIRVENFPAFILTDNKGNDFFDKI